MPARRLPLGLALAALLAALPLAGCGDAGGSPAGAGGPGLDPASLAPPNAAVYTELVVRPAPELRDGALRAARKVLRVADPVAELHRLFDRAIADSHDSGTFGRNYDPWIGDRVGLFVLMPRTRDGDPDFGVAIALRNRAAAEDEIARELRVHELRRGGAYRGVHYDLDDDDDSPNAIVGGFYVVGTMRGFRAAVDASKGEGLADSARYADAVGALDEDRLAFAYVDPGETIRQLAATHPGERTADILRSSPLAHGDPATIALTADADEIALEAAADVEPPRRPWSGGSVSLGDLPGDSWLAFATSPLGPLVRSLLETYGLYPEAAARLREGTGMDLGRDVLDRIGPLAGFVRGTTPLDIGGGLLVATSDAASARRAVTQLQGALGAMGAQPTPERLAGGSGFLVRVPGSPQPIVAVAREDRVAAGYAASSVSDLLEPQQRLEETVAGRAAIGSLGEGFAPSLIVLAPPLVELLRSLDQIGVADLAPAVPYLRAYRSLALGTRREGDRVTLRIVAALR